MRRAPGTEPGASSDTGTAEQEKSGRLISEGLKQGQRVFNLLGNWELLKTAEQDRLPQEAPRVRPETRGLSLCRPRAKVTHGVIRSCTT